MRLWPDLDETAAIIDTLCLLHALVEVYEVPEGTLATTIIDRVGEPLPRS